jgi:hypothetical protein
MYGRKLEHIAGAKYMYIRRPYMPAVKGTGTNGSWFPGIIRTGMSGILPNWLQTKFIVLFAVYACSYRSQTSTISAFSKRKIDYP